MAKGKGKSKRRISNWQQKYLQDDEITDSQLRGSLARRGVKLPADRLTAPNKNLDALPKLDGMVVSLFPGGVIVRTGDEQLLCGIAGTFRPPKGASALAVGDTVTVAVTRADHADSAAAADKNRADGMILARELRQTVLSRPRPRSGKRRDEYKTEAFEKVIVANMDVLLIVAATQQPPLRHGLIDRFLIIAERGELSPVLVINKIDLGPPDEAVLADFVEMDFAIFNCSAATGAGLDDLSASLAGKRSVFAGASGVGKSTLINALIPGAAAATRQVRRKDNRGRHMTSAAAVYELPAGGLLVDTPGIRELGIGLGPNELPWYFPQFEPFAAQCKFNDCTHTHEPHCGIVAAVEAGEIAPTRFESYLRILDTLDEHF